MKRKLIICSSLITIILSCFSFPIFAEETVQDSSTLHSLGDGVFLDQYFYQNYDLLPYLESDGNQYIDTGIIPSNDLILDVRFSINTVPQSSKGIFGSGTRADSNALSVLLTYNHSINGYRLYFASQDKHIDVDYVQNYPYHLHFEDKKYYLDGNLIWTFTNDISSTNLPLYIFSANAGGNNTPYQSSIKIYSFFIYDTSVNSGEGGYVRYYYPAKAKSSGTLGLYDAVNKTFVSTPGVVPFEDPTDDYVMNFQISSFLTNSLTWIGQIFTAIIDMPIVIIFMAIGLAGAMFRWGRRIVHF